MGDRRFAGHRSFPGPEFMAARSEAGPPDPVGFLTVGTPASEIRDARAP